MKLKALERSVSPIMPSAHKMVNQGDNEEYLAENLSNFKMRLDEAQAIAGTFNSVMSIIQKMVKERDPKKYSGENPSTIKLGIDEAQSSYRIC